MSRIITVAAAQLGPIQQAEPRSSAVARMVRLLERAGKRGVELVVFPELALTTFFPRHYHEDISHADSWFETIMPSDETAPLFAAARRFGIGFYLGYAEMLQAPDAAGVPRKRRFNTSILCRLGRTTIFAFDQHRRPEAYGRITARIGAMQPRVWKRSASR
jgi:predicted amidohydrolase